MSLPPLLVLTDRMQTRGRALGDVVASAVRGGARAVVLREKDLPRREREHLAGELRPLLHAVGGTLIVASDASIDADGTHLAANDPWPDTRPRIVGRSCHDAASVAAAFDEGCDYVTLSPIFVTDSKPGYGPALGVSSLHGRPGPTYALGGVTEANASDCWRAGAAGVAVMGSIMRADHADALVRRLLETFEVVS